MPLEPFNVEEKLASLSVGEKVKLLAGHDFWHFESVPSAGIPAVRCSDGPNGVRGIRCAFRLSEIMAKLMDKHSLQRHAFLLFPLPHSIAPLASSLHF